MIKFWLMYVTFPQSSVTLYVLITFSGHDPPSELSPTHSTNGVPQLSAASVIKSVSAGGKTGNCSEGKPLAVGGVSSFKVITWVSVLVFPQASVLVHVLVIVSGQL